MSLQRLYPRSWVRLPRRTIRLRLTLLYGALFLVSGAALLTVTYLLVERQYTQNGASLFVTSGKAGSGGFAIGVRSFGTLPTAPILGTGAPGPAQLEAVARAQSTAALNQLLVNSGIALAIMAVISVWLGWLIAGRALGPLRTITNAARDISATSLHRRLALTGPDDEIKQLGNTFDALIARLEASFDAQRQFVANASHELRTPLTLERTLVEVALADPRASVDSLRQMGEEVLAAGDQQERLIEALLTLTRSQRGLDRHDPIDLRGATAAALQTLEGGALAITRDLEPAWTSGDLRLVERLIANLLSNAARHNIPNGRIEVRTGSRAGRALLTIDNTGPEIPSGELERLFQPFQRLDRERTDSSTGIGLGLSIVQAIATAHQGTVTTRANPAGGLHIGVSLPASSPPSRAGARPRARQVAAPPPHEAAHL